MYGIPMIIVLLTWNVATGNYSTSTDLLLGEEKTE